MREFVMQIPREACRPRHSHPKALGQRGSWLESSGEAGMSAGGVGGAEIREHAGIPRIWFNCMRGEPLESSKKSNRFELYFKRTSLAAMLRAHCWRVEVGRAFGGPRWSSRQELVVARMVGEWGSGCMWRQRQWGYLTGGCERERSWDDGCLAHGLLLLQ